MNAVDRIARSYASEAERSREDLGIAEAQLRDYQTRLGKPFAHVGYLDQLAALRDQLKVALSGAVAEEGPSVADLAEQIKVLRAGNTVEATPERATKRQISAETPVTARIMRKEPGMVVDEAEVVGDRRVAGR
jgi:hypothetical protein